MVKMTAWRGLALSTIIALLSGTPGNASQSPAPGYVQQVIGEQAGAALIVVNTGSTGWPACATAQRFAINTTTPAGQALFSMILNAQNAHTPISIMGNGTCDVWGDSESIAYIIANSPS